MKTLFLKLCAAALVATSAVAAHVQAAELHVMSSGGFTAAYKVLGPKFAAQTGNTLNTALGPSMGKSPEAIRIGLRAASQRTPSSWSATHSTI